MRKIIASATFAMTASLLSVASHAADLGSKKPVLYGPSYAFSPNGSKALHLSFTTAITTAFAGALIQEITAQVPVQNGLSVSGPEGFFFNFYSGIGFGSIAGKSKSNFSTSAVQGLASALTFDAPSHGVFSRHSQLPVSGLAVGYLLSWDRLVVGAVLDGSWTQFRSDLLSKGFYDINPTIAVQPLHRIGSNLRVVGSANARVGWMLNERWLAFVQAGPAFAHAVLAAGFDEPAGAVWKQQNRLLTGGSAALGLTYQSQSRWTLGAEISSAWFRPAPVVAIESSGRYYSLATIRHRYPALKLSIGRAL
jgi:opacity protein-like surface antigen